MDASFPSKQEERHLGKFLQEIQCLENANKLLKKISPSINESVIGRILLNFHSAVMCSPQGDLETCSRLLQMLDRLEEQVFGETGESFRLDDKRMSCNSCESYDPTQGDRVGGGANESSFSVFDHQHPPSPVSTGSATLRSPVLTSSPEFRHSGGGYSPEVGQSHRHPKDIEALKSVCFRRTVRRLEASFVECSSSPRAESAGRGFGAIEFFHERKVSRRNSEPKGKNRSKRASKSRSTDSFDVFPGSSTSAFVKDEKRHFSGRGGDLIPQVACKPLMLVSKASRNRLPLLPGNANNEQSVLKEQGSQPIMPAGRPRLVKGSLQCVAKDGAISYSIWLDDTEELIVAKPASQDISEDQELCDQVFAFSSYKCKGKERSGWRQWGKKDKPVTEVIGKMKIFSTVIPEMDRTGRNRHYLDSDFVLLEARVKDQVAASSPRQQLAVSSSRRLSFSSWDATPSESPGPGCVTSSSSGSPRVVEKSGTGTPGKHWSAVGFLKHNKKDSLSRISDSFSVKGTETGRYSSRTNFVEVAAVATRVPVGLKTRSSSTDGRVNKENAHGLFEGAYEKMNATVVLPAGEHGCPAYGLPGPQPLLERWRGGGKCDCGSWDLGCGLVLLESQQNLRCSAKAAQQQAGCINVVLQARKHEVALSLTPLYDDDTFAVSFRQPLSTFQAFATAVALLHSRRKPQLKLRSRDEKKDEDEERKRYNAVEKSSSKKSFVLPKLLLRGSSFQEAMSLTGIPKIRRVYSLGCRPEPLSLVERV